VASSRSESVKAITPLVGQIQIESEAYRAKASMRVFTSSITVRSLGALRAGKQRLLPLDAQWLQDLAKVPCRPGTCPRSCAAALRLCAHSSRVSLHLTLPCVRRISGERERERLRRCNVPTRTSTSCLSTEGDISSLAPEKHRRGLFDVISGLKRFQKERCIRPPDERSSFSTSYSYPKTPRNAKIEAIRHQL